MTDDNDDDDTPERKTCVFTLEVEYDPAATDPESLSNALDLLLDNARSTPGILDDYGEVRPHSFQVADQPPSLDRLLESWSVLEPGMWENETGPKGWYAVCNDDGIVAYFGNRADAGSFPPGGNQSRPERLKGRMVNA